jgi:O-antigen/teichoic acid export membrane protein
MAGWYVSTTAIGSLASRIDTFMVSTFASVADAGVFSAAVTIAIVPQMVGAYMAVVYTPRIMPLWNAGQLSGIYKRFQWRLVFAAVCIYLAVSTAIQLFGPWLLPPSFARAATLALILFMASLCNLLNFPWTISFLLFVRPKFQLIFEALWLLILLPLYSYTIAHWHAMGAAIVTTGYAVIKTITMQTLAWRLMTSRSEAALQVAPEFATGVPRT